MDDREEHSPSLQNDTTHSYGDKVNACHGVCGKYKVAKTLKLNRVVDCSPKATINFLHVFVRLSCSVMDVNINGETQKEDETWAFK